MAEVTNITVYGTGCKKCKELHKNAVEAAKRVKYDTHVDYVTDILEISAAGIMSTPALVIDGVLVSQGKVLSEGTVLELLGGEGASRDGKGGCSCGGNC